MVKHIVLWTLKDFAEGCDKKENLIKMKSVLMNLKNEIPQLNHLEIGININKTDHAYDIALYSEFNNEADLDIYQNHPEHLKAVDFIRKIRENRVVVDYKL